MSTLYLTIYLLAEYNVHSKGFQPKEYQSPQKVWNHSKNNYGDMPIVTKVKKNWNSWVMVYIVGLII